MGDTIGIHYIAMLYLNNSKLTMANNGFFLMKMSTPPKTLTKILTTPTATTMAGAARKMRGTNVCSETSAAMAAAPNPTITAPIPWIQVGRGERKEEWRREEGRGDKDRRARVEAI